MIGHPMISIVIPAFNEAERLPAFLTSVLSFGRKNFQDGSFAPPLSERGCTCSDPETKKGTS